MLKNKKGLLILVMMTVSALTLLPAIVTPVKAAKTYHVELWYDNSGHYGTTEADVAQMMKTQLEGTGYFDVELKSTDWATYKQQFGTMPTFLLGWWFDYPDESNYIDPFVGGGAFDLGTNYSSSTMDGYIKTMLESSDASARATAQKNAQSLMVEDAPLIPLFSMTKQFVAYGKDMTGVTLEPAETMHFNTFKKGATSTAVTLGTTDSIPTLDPADVYEYWGSNTLNQITHGLFELPVDSTTATPVVADSYKISSDGLKYTFNLKSGLTFTDGSDMRVEDVIWSLNRSASLAGDPAFLLGGIDTTSFTKINNTALSFDLTAKDGTFLQKLTYSNAFIYKQDNSVNNTLQGSGFTPIGLGPYEVSSWTTDEELVLSAYSGYNAAELGTTAPSNTQITEKFFTTSSNLKTAVESGTVDVAFHTFTPDEIVSLEGSSAVNSASKSTAGIRYLIINVQSHPEKAVRQAMEYSIYRPDFVDTIFSGTNVPLYSMVPSIFDNACVKGDSCAYPSNDTAKVKELMEPTYGPNAGSAPGFDYLSLLIAIPVISVIYKKKKN
jgi:ABC-type transport system substrate-binding protein